ncbi:PoNi-like cognate immunity protein [Mycoavidus sp. B2-EB]|uniref:PoNi-like cognate immunity protein n=1 Tax=Mycoavidus sp. B2-EB TaxID=2651972 RepID=UPI001627577B|nr:PoNi-like cognate immunity protein [Mycoavidus sp. B2-EB]BBO59843.1 hypothetical protein MPB2EB_0969 [Mycoavidus sp. B2-EB]
MIRDSLKDKEWFDKWIKFDEYAIGEYIKGLKTHFNDPTYKPQYIFELVKIYWYLMLSCYSRGDAIHELAQYFPPMLDAWEESERLGKDIWDKQTQYTRNAWEVNFDQYINCFWLVGLALALEIPNDQWQRLLVLIGNEGEDELLDRIIASREPSRKIGNKLCHAKPYQRLLDAINAPKDQQAKKLKIFVEKWYAELIRQPKKEQPPKIEALFSKRPYWYNFHLNTIEQGWYFGYWCIEAIAAVKAFGLDDSLCLGHPNYPGDLLRPNGPSTHPERVENDLAVKEEQANETSEKNSHHFWSRLFNIIKPKL